MPFFVENAIFLGKCHFSWKKALLLKKRLNYAFFRLGKSLFKEQIISRGEKNAFFVFEMFFLWKMPFFSEKSPFSPKSALYIEKG